jgi:hypothetical protein
VDTWPSAISIFTRLDNGCCNVPSGPLTVMWLGLICTSTPLATVTGIRATRDMFCSSARYAT